MQVSEIMATAATIWIETALPPSFKDKTKIKAAQNENKGPNTRAQTKINALVNVKHFIICTKDTAEINALLNDKVMKQKGSVWFKDAEEKYAEDQAECQTPPSTPSTQMQSLYQDPQTENRNKRRR